MIQIEIDIAYDEDTLEEALARIERFGIEKVETVAAPAITTTSGAWPTVRLTADFGTVTRWLAEFYDNGDGGETLLEIMRDAKYVAD